MGLFSRKSTPNNTGENPPPYSKTYKAAQPQYTPPPKPSQSATNPDSRPLPNGWITQFDPSSSKWFYVDTRSDPVHRQWEHPKDNSNRGFPGQQAYNQQQQPYYQPQQQPYYQQQQQQQQPQYLQQQQRFNGGRMGGAMPMVATGAMAGLGGFMLGDLIGSHQPDVVNNNYYGDGGGYDNNYDGGFDGGGFDGGGFDGGFGGGDFGGF